MGGAGGAVPQAVRLEATAVVERVAGLLQSAKGHLC